MRHERGLARTGTGNDPCRPAAISTPRKLPGGKDRCLYPFLPIPGAGDRLSESPSVPVPVLAARHLSLARIRFLLINVPLMVRSETKMKNPVNQFAFCWVLAVLSFGLSCGSHKILFENPSPFNLADITPSMLNFQAAHVCVEGNYAYMSDTGIGLLVADITDPANPRRVKLVDVPGASGPIAAANGVVCMADFRNDVTLVDVTQPESAHIAGTFDALSSVYGISMREDYAYLAAESGRLIILDIGNPESVIMVGSVLLPSSAYGVAVFGNQAFVSCYNDVYIVDISNPGSPLIVGAIEGSDSRTDIAVSDGRAYLVRGSSLAVFNIDQPDSLDYVAGCWLYGSPNGVVVSNGYAYVTDSDSGLHVVDIDPIEDLHLVKTVALPGGPRNAVISGDAMYVANQDDSLLVLDISSPSKPEILASVPTPGLPRRVQVSDGFACTVDYDGLRVTRIGAPDSALAVAWVDVEGAACLALSGATAYVPFYWWVYVNGISEYVAGVVSVDITSPEQPRPVGWLKLSPYQPYSAVTSGGRLYIASSGGLLVVDISRPESPALLKTISVSGYAESVAVRDGYAYLFGYYGLQVVDIDPLESAHVVNAQALDQPDIGSPGESGDSPPEYVDQLTENPRTASMSPPYFSPCSNRIVVEGETAFLLQGYANILRIVDLSQPESPRLIGTCALPGSGTDLAVSDGYAFVTCGEDGLIIADVDPPDTAAVVDIIDTPATAYGVAISNEYAYIADYLSGLRIIALGRE